MNKRGPSPRPCPLCGSDPTGSSFLPSTVFNGRTFNYLTCSGCQALYVDPAPSPEDLAAIYGRNYHDQHYYHSSEDRESLFQQLEQAAPNRRLLDFGCGDGRFLKYAASRGWEVFGVEFEQAVVDRLKTELPEAQFETLENLGNLPREIGVVHLGDVFEHLVEPMRQTQLLLQHLLPRGVLFVEGPIETNPSLSGLLMRAYFEVKRVGRSPNALPVGRHAPTHLVFTNRHNQLAAFRKLGLETLHYELDEEARPMPARWKWSDGLKRGVKYLIGQSSIRLGRRLPDFGNRFLYLGIKV